MPTTNTRRTSGNTDPPDHTINANTANANTTSASTSMSNATVPPTTTPPAAPSTPTARAGAPSTADAATGRPAPPPGRASSRSDDIAAAVFSTWVVVGLFLDGWAHRADKPESFFTPWHAVLYSGFVTAMLWFGVGEVRERRAQLARGASYEPPGDRLVLLGFGCFAVAGLGDLVWHSVFGVEADVAALLSPVHLLLMGGGLLLVTSPVRSALRQRQQAPSLRAFLPAAVGVTLAAAIVVFFLQFGSVLAVSDEYPLTGSLGEARQALGITSVLLPNVVLLGVMTWTLRRWACPPAGTFTLLLGGTAVMTAGLAAFEMVALALPAIAAGAVADLLVGRGTRPVVVVTVTPLVMWSGWFAVYHAVWGLGWEVELWSGSIIFTMLTGLGLSLVSGPDSDRAPVAIGDLPPG